MSETKKSKKTKKHIIDVQAPGTSAPPQTSRPVIVTNRSLLRDPMVTTTAADQPPNKDEPKPAADQSAEPAPSHEAVIKPLDDSAADNDQDQLQESRSEEDQASPPAPAETVSAVEDTSEAVGTPEEKDDAPAESESQDAVSDLPTVPVAAESTNPTASDPGSGDPSKPPTAPAAKQAEAEAAAKAKHEAEVQQLVTSRQYELPINTTEQQKSKRFVLLGTVLAVVLVIIWLDIALDAGIIKLGGLGSLTHFFSN